MDGGTVFLVIAGAFSGATAEIAAFGPREWIAELYLGAGPGAMAYVLWVLALKYASPTRVAGTMTANPLAAALLAIVPLDEPITLGFVSGLLVVFVGIWIATSQPKTVQTTSE